MDPVSPVAQLVVAAVSGTAFLLSMAVIPIPSVHQEAAGVRAPLSFPVTPGTTGTTSVRAAFDPGVK